MNGNQRRSRAVAPIMSAFKRMILIICIIFLFFVLYKEFRVLKDKESQNIKKNMTIDSLQHEIDSQEEKLEELRKNKNQVITDEDYEAYAREELGLIKKDEIVIRPR